MMAAIITEALSTPIQDIYNYIYTDVFAVQVQNWTNSNTASMRHREYKMEATTKRLRILHRVTSCEHELTVEKNYVANIN